MNRNKLWFNQDIIKYRFLVYAQYQFLLRYRSDGKTSIVMHIVHYVGIF